ncbi:MAG: tripartite tricarboxylate transporter substrate binding protein [Betaproteobacteria bacterium]|nr:tripartite tricarboxylate transporter substrate binding protein [Betaproteobacteria bacterium]
MLRTITLLLVACISALAQAQTFPSKQIHIVVPYPPGGTNDVFARLVADQMNTSFTQRTIVENRPGAMGIVGSEYVVRSPADGHTLLLGGVATHSTNPHLVKDLKYDPIRDFAPVSLVASFGNVLVVHPTVPVNTVSEFIAYAKANPGKLNFGIVGVGSSMSLAAELFKARTGANIVAVNYKGSALAVTDLVGGQIESMFANIVSVVSNVNAGKLKALGVTANARDPLLPQVPTIAEAGVPGYELTSWSGLFAPAGTPAHIVERISKEVQAMVANPAVRKRFADVGAVPGGTSPAAFAAFTKRDYDAMGNLIREQGLKIEAK